MLLVTWIAPIVPRLPPLAWLDELGHLSNLDGVRVTPRTGDVTLEHVAAALGMPCDVLVWAGHGMAGGLALSDGSLVRPLWLASRLANKTVPKVAILAACGSQARDDTLQSLTEVACRAGVSAVGFPAQTDDISAAVFVREMVRALEAGDSLMRAFDVGIESIRDNETARGVRITMGARDASINVLQELREIRKLLEEIYQFQGAPQVAAGMRSNTGTVGGTLPIAGNTLPIGHLIGIGPQITPPLQE